MIVLDASAAVEWLLGRPGAEPVSRRLADPDVTLHAPATLGVEVAAALRGLVLGRHASAMRAGAALDDLAAMGIETYDPMPLLARAWALRDNLTVYDATYVALAEVLGAVLVTADARLASAPGLRATIEVVPTPGGRGLPVDQPVKNV